jgi:hypothetical protein
VSTFYLLPPRPLMGDRVADFLHAVLPGLDWDSAMRTNLAEAVAAAASVHADVYVVFRDDLPAGQQVAASLAYAFGAEAGDEIIEVRPDGAYGGLTARRWSIGTQEAA